MEMARAKNNQEKKSKDRRPTCPITRLTIELAIINIAWWYGHKMREIEQWGQKREFRNQSIHIWVFGFPVGRQGPLQ